MGRFYDKAIWKKTRRLQLSKQPLCEYCTKIGMVVVATDVDHVVRMSEGGAALDPNNLQSLCHRCHSNKTGREKHGLTVIIKGCDDNGMPLDPNHPWHS
mgnify:CR=1 FL=1